jgi:uncharacterized protein (TIGR01568 family)
MSSSWFYKQQLRRNAVTQQKPPPPPCSPNRPSYYFPSRSRDPANQPGGDIVFDVVPRFHDDDATMLVHELKLRPILTKPATSDTTAPPTARVRLHARRKPPPGESCSCRRWLRESVVLVKESAEPEEDFLASMREMIAANRVGVRSLPSLLACYLALNAADHHRAVVAAFRRACLDLD